MQAGVAWGDIAYPGDKEKCVKFALGGVENAKQNCRAMPLCPEFSPFLTRRSIVYSERGTTWKSRVTTMEAGR